LRMKVEELKFSSGGNVGRRQAIDDFETHLTEATEKMDRNKNKFERMAKMQIDVKAGVGHLAEVLWGISLDGDKNIEMTDESLEEVLGQCELKISRLLGMTQDADNDNERKKLADEEFEEKQMMKSQSAARIRLKDKEDEADSGDDEFDEEMDEDVTHRKQVKYNSEQILEKQQTKNRKKAKKGK